MLLIKKSDSVVFLKFLQVLVSLNYSASQPLSLPSLPKLSRDGSSQRSILPVKFSSVQFSRSVVSNSVTPWTAARHASLSVTNSRSLLKLMSIESVMPSNHLFLCCPLFSHLQPFPASGSFPRSQFFTSGGHRIGASASASVLPMRMFRTDLL